MNDFQEVDLKYTGPMGHHNVTLEIQNVKKTKKTTNELKKYTIKGKGYPAYSPVSNSVMKLK